MESGQRARPAVMLMTALMMALSIITLQRCFDESDRKKAYEMVRNWPVAGGTIQQALLSLADGGATYCKPPELVSSCAGTLVVDCFAGDDESYRFSVDLVRRSVGPLNDRAQKVMAAAADGGPPAGAAVTDGG